MAEATPFADSGRATRGRLHALLAPHIDYARGGVSYAWAYKELAEQCDAGVFVIVGTSHCSPARFTLTRQHFNTPLGMVTTDQDYVDRIVSHYGDGLFDDPLAHLPEHSIELEVVYLQHLFAVAGQSASSRFWSDRLRIVSILARTLRLCPTSPPWSRPCGGRRPSAGGRVLHYQRGFGPYRPKFGDEGRLKSGFLADSRNRDRAILEMAEAVDPDGYFRLIAAEGDAGRICGLPPTWTVLQAIRPKRGQVLHYEQYVHPRGFESVPFASAAFYA